VIAFTDSLERLPKPTFVRAWGAIAYLYPGLHPDGFHFGAKVLQMPHIVVLMVQTMVWGMKVITLCWLQILIRWTLPRIRPDQLMDLGWKRLLPVSIANILITAGVVLWKMAQ
jgi:NADH-quinone oxidoreductase subunit H